ncbi:tyrosine-type recombinase/integrase [Burkholderiaceae bacterium]|nr:tyrosine-type recombinase/integrase [Burkholderiaceae bacterium]
MSLNIARNELYDLLAHIEGAYAPNTLRAYKADMLEFISYCVANDECALPASPSTISNFLLQTIQQGIKSSTIRRKVSSISAIHRLTNLTDPTKQPEVKIAQRKIYRKLGTRFDQAHPINRPLLEKMVEACALDLRGLRDRALLMVAYDTMRRRSELVSLRIEDIEWLSNGGASVLLRKNKTDQHGTGKWIHLSPETARAIRDWLLEAQISFGYIFRGVRGMYTVLPSLSESRIPRIFKSLAKRANLNAKTIRNISGHSMRVGGAQDLLSGGASLPQIMVKGGWAKTDTVMRYVDRIQPTSFVT